MNLRPIVAVSLTALATFACSPQESAPDTDGTWVGTITTEGNVTTVVPAALRSAAYQHLLSAPS